MRQVGVQNGHPAGVKVGARVGRTDGYLSDGHGAENVEEDEGAVGVVFAQQVAVRQALDVGQRHEGQLGHHAAVKTETTDGIGRFLGGRKRLPSHC